MGMMKAGDTNLEITMENDFTTDDDMIRFIKYDKNGNKKAFILVVRDSAFFDVAEGNGIPKRLLI